MDYSTKTRSELKEICSNLEIKGFSKKNKTQLILMIREKESSKPIESKEEKKVASDMSTFIEKICQHIASIDNENIILLRNKEVIQWIFFDLSFLPHTKNKEDKKDLEKEWGKKLFKEIRPDLKPNKMWTGIVGECICKEIYIILGKTVTIPVKKEELEPDWEIDDAILEVKTQTFLTSGTAAEKIPGCPFKYADVPELYGKPLKIICIAGAEKYSREHNGNLPGAKVTRQKQKILDFFRELQCEFIAATDIFKSMISE
jgi:hypothetical protein